MQRIDLTRIFPISKDKGVLHPNTPLYGYVPDPRYLVLATQKRHSGGKGLAR